MRGTFRTKGLSLLELMLSILLIAIIAGSSAYYATNSVDARRYEDTRTHLEMLLTAILGDTSVNNEGARSNFGYHGDMGRIPTTLADLTAIGTQAAWSYDSTYGMGAGWRGPYIVSQFTGGQPLDKDEWGHSFLYDTGAFTLKSYAADNASGGTVYGKDLVVNFPAARRLATVQGILLDSNTVVKNKTVTIAYPADGALTTGAATSDASTGTFSFSNIPLGIRALKVTGTTQTLGYKQISVDSAQYYVSNNFLNFSADLQKVVGSGAVTTGTSNGTAGARIQYAVDNSYEATLTLSYVTCWWTGTDGAFLKAVTLDGTTESVTNCLNSGQRSNQLSTLTLTNNTTGKNFYLDFTTNNCTTGKAISSNVVINCKLEWSLAASNPDAISMKVP